jgi:structural maintenance of chromosome 1
MDALSFVLGVRTLHLRGSHLKELIYRADDEDTARRRCSVKV